MDQRLNDLQDAKAKVETILSFVRRVSVTVAEVKALHDAHSWLEQFLANVCDQLAALPVAPENVPAEGDA